MQPLMIGGKRFEWGQKTYLMGILNITPDSFSGDGTLASPQAVVKAHLFEKVGADILDIGGESTRPGAVPVSAGEELKRVLPVLNLLKNEINLPLSIDSFKPGVVRAALEAGASLINDVTGLSDPAMQEMAVEFKVPVVVMHSRGNPQSMARLTDYGGDLLGELERFFEQRLAELVKLGVSLENIILDPGIGFAKNGVQNLEILRELPRLRRIGRPLLVGVSRKAFLGRLAGGPGREAFPPSQREAATITAVTLAIAGGADLVRVHDVETLAGAIRVADAVTRPGTFDYSWL